MTEAKDLPPSPLFSPAIETLDARGLKCPLPVLKAGKLLRKLPALAHLRILVTDPGAPKDFEHFCATTGALLIGMETTPSHVIITLQRAAS